MDEKPHYISRIRKMKNRRERLLFFLIVLIKCSLKMRPEEKMIKKQKRQIRKTLTDFVKHFLQNEKYFKLS